MKSESGNKKEDDKNKSQTEFSDVTVPPSASSDKTTDDKAKAITKDPATENKSAEPKSDEIKDPAEYHKLFQTPELMQQVLLSYLDTKDAGTLAEASTTFFKYPKYEAKLKELKAITPKYLQHVVYGEQKEAEEMLQKNPWLFFVKGDVTDYSGREFKDVSGFQYALWAYDTHMWRMMLNVFKNLPEEQKGLANDALGHAREQLKELEIEKKGLNYTFKVGEDEKKDKDQKDQSDSRIHYDFNKLIKALRKYVEYCQDKNKNYNWREAERIWQKEVGGAQRLVPVHVANQYCRRDSSFSPTPDFDAKYDLPRTVEFYVEVFFPLDSDPKHRLGFNLGIYKGPEPPGKAMMCLTRGDGWMVLLDLEAMTTLFQVRKQDLENLMMELNVSPTKDAKIS